jgi:hypothetical protein
MARDGLNRGPGFIVPRAIPPGPLESNQKKEALPEGEPNYEEMEENEWPLFLGVLALPVYDLRDAYMVMVGLGDWRRGR